MATEIDNWVGQFVSARGPGEANIASRPELGKIAGELNLLFWREAERLLARSARENPDRMVFSPDERLLLDLGLLDYRLVPGGEKIRPVLLKEIYEKGRPSYLYFSEWMAQRFRQFLLYGGMAPPEDIPSRSRIIRDLRQRLYMKLTLLFRDLPGFSPQHIELFLSGRIDETLEAMTSMLDRSIDERTAEQRRQLLEIRTRLIARARERTRTTEDLALFDSLRAVDRQSAESRSSQRAPSPSAPTPRTLVPEQREKWVQDELKFVKSALWLGIMGSGLMRTYSVLLTGQTRTTKADLEVVLSLAKHCDPTLSETSAVVIAPYVGGGFYDWDRDTLFTPLVSTRGADQSVVQALATYRILLDQFQQGAKLRKEYEALGAGSGEDFNQSFVRDYKAWILGVGKGFKGALDPVRYAFFRDRLGPQSSNLYAPHEWAALTPQENEELVRQLRQKVNRAEAEFDDYYRLAIACMRSLQLVQAEQYLQSALTVQPMDGRILLALGHLTLRLGTPDAARARFSECMALAPNTIWSVYAAEEAQKL